MLGMPSLSTATAVGADSTSGFLSSTSPGLFHPLADHFGRTVAPEVELEEGAPLADNESERVSSLFGTTTRLVVQEEVEVGKVKEPVGLLAVELLGCPEVLQVLIVCPNLELVPH